MDVAANIFENREENQAAARTPLSGTIGNPNADLFATLGSVLRNAKADMTPIRPLQPTDRERWNELWRGYLEFYEHPLPADLTELTWRRLLDPAHPFHSLAALDEQGRIVGIVHFHFHASTWARVGYCYLEDLFVDPVCRGKGLGRALIEAVYSAADEHGAERVYWHTENTNERAQHLYRQVAELTPFVQYRRRR